MPKVGDRNQPSVEQECIIESEATYPSNASPLRIVRIIAIVPAHYRIVGVHGPSRNGHMRAIVRITSIELGLLVHHHGLHVKAHAVAIPQAIHFSLGSGTPRGGVQKRAVSDKSKLRGSDTSRRNVMSGASPEVEYRGKM